MMLPSHLSTNQRHLAGDAGADELSAAVDVAAAAAAEGVVAKRLPSLSSHHDRQRLYLHGEPRVAQLYLPHYTSDSCFQE